MQSYTPAVADATACHKSKNVAALLAQAHMRNVNATCS
jgi:hypothetical protein